MFETCTYKRLHGLTAAHFLDASLRNPTMLITLPFDQNRVPRYITDNILHRVHERWEWFSKAAELNHALGTLSYLPGEVRLLIWRSLLQCQDTLSSDGVWEYSQALGSPFQPSAYYFGFGRRGLFLDSVESLRMVSKQIKAEYDYVFLSLRSFRFNYHQNLFAFCDRMHANYLNQLSSVELAICTQAFMNPRLDSISLLPPGLQHVHFRIRPAPRGWYDSERGHEILEILGVLVEQVALTVPNARISISSTLDEPLQPACRAYADSILAKPSHVNNVARLEASRAYKM